VKYIEIKINRKKETKEMNELKGFKAFLKEEDGMGTVELILIIVVLISLVIIFKEQLTDLVNTIFKKINKQANSI
jgi:Flp pilus assembly pilin Flp